VEQKYRFKLFFRFQQGTGVRKSSKRILLTELEEAEQIFLHPATDKPSNGVDRTNLLTLVGGPYDSVKLADEVSLKAKKSVMLWSLIKKIGVDFNALPLKDANMPQSERLEEPKASNQAAYIRSGIIIEPYENNSLHILIDLIPNAETQPETFGEYIIYQMRKGPCLTPKQTLALELYGGSFFDDSERSKFVARVSAVEALLEEVPLSEETQKIVESLQELVRVLPIDDDEREVVVNRLREAKKQSISLTGRMLAHDLLSDRIYGSLPAAAAFHKCYKARSKLLHTGLPGVGHEEFSELCNICKDLVGDLLTSSIINHQAELTYKKD
jgi:hypothetical protein